MPTTHLGACASQSLTPPSELVLTVRLLGHSRALSISLSISTHPSIIFILSSLAPSRSQLNPSVALLRRTRCFQGLAFIFVDLFVAASVLQPVAGGDTSLISMSSRQCETSGTLTGGRFWSREHRKSCFVALCS